jgi:hypothetical protein
LPFKCNLQRYKAAQAELEHLLSQRTRQKDAVGLCRLNQVYP